MSDAGGLEIDTSFDVAFPGRPAEVVLENVEGITTLELDPGVDASPDNPLDVEVQVTEGPTERASLIRRTVTLTGPERFPIPQTEPGPRNVNVLVSTPRGSVVTTLTGFVHPGPERFRFPTPDIVATR